MVKLTTTSGIRRRLIARILAHNLPVHVAETAAEAAEGPVALIPAVVVVPVVEAGAVFNRYEPWEQRLPDYMANDFAELVDTITTTVAVAAVDIRAITSVATLSMADAPVVRAT